MVGAYEGPTTKVYRASFSLTSRFTARGPAADLVRPFRPAISRVVEGVEGAGALMRPRRASGALAISGVAAVSLRPRLGAPMPAPEATDLARGSLQPPLAASSICPRAAIRPLIEGRPGVTSPDRVFQATGAAPLGTHNRKARQVLRAVSRQKGAGCAVLTLVGALSEAEAAATQAS